MTAARVASVGAELGWIDTAAAAAAMGVSEYRMREMARTGVVAARKVRGGRGVGTAGWAFKASDIASRAAKRADRARQREAVAARLAKKLPGGERTLTDLADRYILERKARQEILPNSVTTMREQLWLFCQAVPNRPSSVNRGHIGRWLYGLEHCAPATVRSRLSTARTFLEWCVNEGHLKRNPAAGIRGPRVPRGIPRALTHEQVTAVLAAAPDNRAGLMMSLGVQEGLRCQEIAGLEVGDVDLIERSLLVRHGKGGHQRLLPLSDETAGYLRRYLTEHPARAGVLIRSYLEPTRPISSRYVVAIIARIMHDAGVAETAHSLRHTMATDILRRGAHLRDVQRALGHQDLGTTQRYLPQVVGDLRAAMGGREYREDASASRPVTTDSTAVPDTTTTSVVTPTPVVATEDRRHR